MSSNGDNGFPVFSLVYNIFAIPYNFIIGFVVGVAAPVAVVAAMVAGIRFLTGRMPFLSLDRKDEDADRHLSLTLVAPEEVESLLEVQKTQISDELGDLKAEIQSIIEEARAESGETTMKIEVVAEEPVEGMAEA